MKKNEKSGLKAGFDFIGVCCVFFCHDGKGQLLLHKRSKNCRDEIGKWDCGGGTLEFGETFEEAVRREIKEEYCVMSQNLKFCGMNNVLRKHNGAKTHWVSILFSAEVNPKKVKIGEPRKMDEIGWFPKNKLPKPLHSMLREYLNMIRKAGVKI